LLNPLPLSSVRQFQLDFSDSLFQTVQHCTPPTGFRRTTPSHSATIAAKLSLPAATSQ